MIDYKFNEGNILKEVQDYVDSTYSQHYASNSDGAKKIQTSELIISSGRGEGFLIGNIQKYTDRYGKKGGPAKWREDLMKSVHYGIMMIYAHDLQQAKLQSEQDQLHPGLQELQAVLATTPVITH
jgi:hypothetical protein